MKYPIGTKVRVISLPDSLNEDEAPIGSEGIVIAYGNNPKYSVESSCFKYRGKPMDWNFHEENLELVTKETNHSSNELIKKTLYSPLTVQQAGDHYKKKGIQPIEYGFANDLSFPQINIVKYVTRHEDKNGLDDLAKSIHYHFFEALRVYGEEGSDELRKKVLKLLEFDEAEQGGL